MAVKIWAAGGWWTPYRKFLAGIPGETGECPHCGADKADVYHIVMECAAARRAVNDLLMEPLQVFLDADPVSKAAFLEGICIDPENFGPGPACEDAVEYWSAELGDVLDPSLFEGEMYIDGSGANWADGHIRRASWSVVKMNDDCTRVNGWARGPVWRELPQTSGVAEWCGLAAATHLAQGSFSIVTDYRGVQQGFRNPWAVCSAKNKCAALAREAFSGAGKEKIVDQSSYGLGIFRGETKTNLSRKQHGGHSCKTGSWVPPKLE